MVQKERQNYAKYVLDSGVVTSSYVYCSDSASLLEILGTLFLTVATGPVATGGVMEFAASVSLLKSTKIGCLLSVISPLLANRTGSFVP